MNKIEATRKRASYAWIKLIPRTPTKETFDVLRIPANNKSRFSLEDVYCERQQASYCNLLFRQVGVNRDLVQSIGERWCKPILEPTISVQQECFVCHQPDQLAWDLRKFTPGNRGCCTIEDKDPCLAQR